MTLISKAGIRLASLLFVLLASSACSHLSLYTQAPIDIPSRHVLNVPFFPQTQYHCGPAALAGIFHYHQITTEPEEIADWVYLPGKKGSLQLEMQAAIRRQGLVAYPLIDKTPGNQLATVLREIAVGNPVLLLQNLGFSWWPNWHYAIAVGYDLDTQQIILHSGNTKNHTINLRTLLLTWRRANYWALLPLPPARLPATASSQHYVKAASDLEATGHIQAAAQAYQTALNKWPQTPLALMGLGNSLYSLKNYSAAKQAFQQLATLQPDNAFAWNNLAYSWLALNCFEQAKRAVDKAMKIEPNNKQIQGSLKEINKLKTKQPSSCPTQASE